MKTTIGNTFMKNGILKFALVAFFICSLFMLPLGAYAKDEDTLALKMQINELQAKVDAYETEKALEEKNLDLYDEMDLVAFSNHDIEHIDRLHADDVKVINPDLSEVHGIEQHGKDMESILTTFPDLVIESHPLKFASGDWTAGLAISRGTFNNPFKLPDGTEIPPNGNKFVQAMITLAKWEDGKIIEEYLFYDNMDFMKQLGLLNQESGQS